MRPYFAAILLVLVALSASAMANPSIPAKTCGVDDTFKSFFGPARAYRVKIESEGGVVSTLELPKGVYLSLYGASGSKRGEMDASTGTQTFSGDLTLRIRRADELVEGESAKAVDIMARAPLAMELRNVSVEVVAEER